MFTDEQTKKYRLQNTNKFIETLSFQLDQNLWIKGSNHPQYSMQEILTLNSKFQFTKKGRILGLQVKRYILLHHFTLFYFQDLNSNNYVGYCDLTNIYVQFLRTEQNKYILGLSNRKQRSVLFFQSNRFYQTWNRIDFRKVIQLNYYTKYYISEFIGQGSFASVYKVTNRQNGDIMAAKIIYKIDKKGKQTMDYVLAERNILANIPKSDQVYRMHQFFQESQKFIMVTDYAEGTQLATIIKSKENLLNLNQIKFILKEILIGLDTLHKNKIIHRDLKPQNIMVELSKRKVKIIDFGLALMLQKAKKKDYKKCGTIGYMAPQVISNNAESKSIYNEKIDIFSFGIIAHMLLLGNNPIKGKNYNQTQIKNEECNFKLNRDQIINKYGQESLELLLLALSKSPENRLSASQLLKLPFFGKSAKKYRKDSGILLQGINKEQDNFDIDMSLEKIQVPRNSSIVKKFTLFS